MVVQCDSLDMHGTSFGSLLNLETKGELIQEQ
jgi:hypothetical protein